MDCPRCRCQMKELSVENIKPFLCPKCEGSWFTKDDLEVVKSMTSEQLEASELNPTLVGEDRGVDLEEHLDCPVCKEPLVRYRDPGRPHLVVDRCPEHGIWLDDGELSQMMQPLEEMQKRGFLAFLRGLF